MKHLIAIAFFGLTTIFSFAQSNEIALQGPSMVSYSIGEEDMLKRVTAQNAAKQISEYVSDNMNFTQEFEYVNETRIKAAVEISAEGNIKKVEIINGSNNSLETTLSNVIKEYEKSDKLKSHKAYTVIIPFVFTNS